MTMHATDQLDREPTGELPNRGTILCVFTNNDTVDAYETELSRRGFTLMRARHGMHGYWLAVNSQPDVIVTDVINPNDESCYLLDCLDRNIKTKHIPVVAIVERATQDHPGASCLRGVASCFLNGTRPDELVAEIDIRVPDGVQDHPKLPAQRRSRFDMFFADLRHSTPKAHWSQRKISRANRVEPFATHSVGIAR
jgi:response regulator RpfG family c-di-GMP phosphodiesterase